MTWKNSIERRGLLRGAALTTLVVPIGGMAPGRSRFSLRDARICHVATDPALRPPHEPAADAPLTPLKLTWNATAICTVGVPTAIAKGFFAKHGLSVELINFGGSTDQLLEAIATGKADAGVGMALRWLKPLEQGFDVKITTAIHGGCMRLFAKPDSHIDGIAGLRGKTVGVGDLAGPDKNFFSIAAAKQGIDPTTEIEWRAYPADMLGVALQKGEVQVISLSDPLGWIVRERDGFLEIANNLSGEYAHRTCCVLGVRGSLLREDRATAARLTAALTEAQEFVAENPDKAAAIFAPYSKVQAAQLAAMLKSHTHHHHPAGAELKDEIAAYADELKMVHVFKASTDPKRFAERVCADVA